MVRCVFSGTQAEEFGIGLKRLKERPNCRVRQRAQTFPFHPPFTTHHSTPGRGAALGETNLPTTAGLARYAILDVPHGWVGVASRLFKMPSSYSKAWPPASRIFIYLHLQEQVCATTTLDHPIVMDVLGAGEARNPRPGTWDGRDSEPTEPIQRRAGRGECGASQSPA